MVCATGYNSTENTLLGRGWGRGCSHDAGLIDKEWIGREVINLPLGSGRSSGLQASWPPQRTLPVDRHHCLVIL